MVGEIRFSIVIPLFNKEISIVNTIKSVLRQTYACFEIIVIDDCSNDNSLAKVNTISDPRLKVIRNKINGGVSKTRNIGILKANYEYIAFLDADDYWKENYLEEMNLLIQKYPNGLLYFTPHFNLNGSQKISTAIISKPKNFQGTISIFDYSLSETPWTSAVVIKKALNEKLLFDENLIKGEDIDLWIRYALTGSVIYYNKELSYCNQDAENRAMNRDTPKRSSLINNLNRFDPLIKQKKGLKLYLNKMRIEHLKNHLKNGNSEVININELINEISLNSLNPYWKVFRILNTRLQKRVIKLLQINQKLWKIRALLLNK